MSDPPSLFPSSPTPPSGPLPYRNSIFCQTWEIPKDLVEFQWDFKSLTNQNVKWKGVTRKLLGLLRASKNFDNNYILYKMLKSSNLKALFWSFTLQRP